MAAGNDGEVCGGAGNTIDGVSVMEVCCGLKGRFVTIQKTDTADAPLEVAEILMTATGEGCGDKVDEHQSSGNCVITAPVVGTYDDGLNDGSCP